MKILGISAGFHDAAISVIQDEKILFAGHAERYSKDKHDKHISVGLIEEALSYDRPDIIAYYERPWLKKLRQLSAGQYSDALTLHNLTVTGYLKERFPMLKLDGIKTMHCGHHLSHAASGFQTSNFNKATVVVIDAIGEWDTISILGASYDDNGKAKYKKLWSQQYPHSIGLFYSAMTKRIKLRPLDEEYILMGMAAYGQPKFTMDMMRDLIADPSNAVFKQNFHAGISDSYFGNDVNSIPEQDKYYHIAASTQLVTEILINHIMQKASRFEWSNNLVYTGGVALNCTANRTLGDYFDNIWIMPNPGDAGSSLGAAALAYGKALRWDGPYLGKLIAGQYPVAELIKELQTTKIVGVANGRAEFGPRALGNRSLLADPRGWQIKDRVNEIKQRQKFRPFAPVILEEYVGDYFKLPTGFCSSPYMQVVAECCFPDRFPAICHIDNTSRVQTVSRDCKSGIRQLLERWFEITGCPMLLNTSLNIRGEPMVNDEVDAKRFERKYGVKVLT